MKNRWLNGALPAVLIHVSVGSIYAFSVLTKHIMENTGVGDKGTVTWIFSIAILFLGMSAAFLGNTVEKIGPRKSAFICCFFYGTGFIGAGIAALLCNLPLFFLFYGVLGGIGLGVGYITPLKTLMRWFYDRKGFAAGIAVMGFGFAAMIAGPVMEALIEAIGLARMFFVTGFCYMVFIAGAALLISPPPKGYEKPGTGAAQDVQRKQYTTAQAVRTPSFYALWFMFFVNISGGISLLPVASPMLQDKFPLVMTAAASAAVVGIISLCNGLGRIGWSSLSDILGRPAVFSGFLLLQSGLFLGLAFTDNHIVFQFFLFAIASCYGGGFACMPAYLSDMFGVQHVSAIQGRILTAWACAGIAGPAFTNWAVKTSGGYTSAFIGISIALVLAFSVSVITAKRHSPR